MIESELQPEGFGEIIIDYKDGDREVLYFRNKIINDGRVALAKSLSNQYGGNYEYWVYACIFGDQGFVSGTPRYVNANQAGLFGPTLLAKPVISSISASSPSRVVFTCVILFEDLVGVAISEMALQMKIGDCFSVTTFSPINKTSEMQVTINWSINFV